MVIDIFVDYRPEIHQPEIDWWGSEADSFTARVETEQAWKVSIDEIKERNYNLDIKNPHVTEQVIHDPDVLLAKYAKQQAEAAVIREALKKELMGCLGKAK